MSHRAESFYSHGGDEEGEMMMTPIGSESPKKKKLNQSDIGEVFNQMSKAIKNCIGSGFSGSVVGLEDLCLSTLYC